MRRDKKNRNPPQPGSREANVPKEVLDAALKRETDEGGFITDNLRFPEGEKSRVAPALERANIRLAGPKGPRG